MFTRIQFFLIKFSNLVEYPLWDVKFETETEMKPKKFKSKVEAAYTNAYKTKFLLDLQKDMKTVNDFHGKINVIFNQFFLITLK